MLIGASYTCFAQESISRQPVVLDANRRERSPLRFEPPPIQFDARMIEQVAYAEELPPGMIRLNLEGNIRLEALLKLVEQRMRWNLIYDKTIGERSINVRAPREIPADALPILLSSILRMENLAIVDADVPGWRRIVDAGGMAGLAKIGNPQESLARDGAEQDWVEHVRRPEQQNGGGYRLCPCHCDDPAVTGPAGSTARRSLLSGVHGKEYVVWQTGRTSPIHHGNS
jgi:hypothetical protein